MNFLIENWQSEIVILITLGAVLFLIQKFFIKKKEAPCEQCPLNKK